MRRIAQYEIIEEIGRGGFATVYRARDTRMGREVALKVIAGNFAQEPAFMERFRQEALTAASVRHARIVTVYDFGDADGMLYLAMALIGEGRTLRNLLAEQVPLSLGQALSILAQLADALDYLHRRDPPLTHRDVKPANVLLEGDEPEVILTDFGLVRSMEASTELTRSGTILGTPAYMAPEQANPELDDVGPAADLYALGVVAYEMLAGRVPFEGEPATLLHAHAYEEPPSPLEFIPDLGDDLTEALLRALAKSPTKRYSSAGAFVAALQGVANARTAAAEREATLEQLEAQARELLDASEWLQALDCCTQMVRLDPDRPAALEMLTSAKEGLDRERAEAMERRRLEERYTEGLRLLGEGEWKQAIVALEEVAEGNPDFRDVQDKLAQARDELQRAQWYDEAIVYGEAERWAEACRLWVRVLSGRLDYRDGDATSRLLDATDGLLSQHEQAREALALYDALMAAVEAGDWKRAIEVGERLLQLAPDLNGPKTWLDRAQRSELERLLTLLQQENGMIWERDGKEMVRVPAGEFLYGAGKQKVKLSEFWIDKTPVTNAEYARFVAATGHEPPRHWKGKTPPQEIANHPVTYVSWHDAVAYAEWAGKWLPTKEGWGKAASGTDGRRYPWGDQEPTPKLCNFGENERLTTPVGRFSPQGDSPYGCVDMAGNVWEWTGSDSESGGKVLCGGSWRSKAGSVRCAPRGRSDPVNRIDDVGFRCARVSE